MRIIEPYQLNGRKKKRRKLKAFSISLSVLVIIFGGYTAFIFYRGNPLIYPSYLIQTSEQQNTVTLPWPAYGQSAIGAAGFDVLATSGNHPAAPTASMAKVMTALTILKKHPLALNQSGPTITLTEADVQLYRDYLNRGGSVLPIAAGEQISLYQALQGLLLPSGNNIADSLAVWAFGSINNYLTSANALAKSLGMNQTIFADDASGLSPKSVSTAHDLVILGLAALQEPVLAQIVGQPNAILPVAGPINNLNTLVGKNDIIGIKTGNTDEAGSCYLFAATKILSGDSKVTIVGVVMGAQNLPVAFRDALNLITAAQSNFSEQMVVRANESVAEYRLPWQKPITVYAQTDISHLTWRGRSSQPKVVLNPLRELTIAGQQTGAISANNGQRQVTSPLLIKEEFRPPSLLWRLTHPLSN